jgi:hypothetical protein
MGDPLKDLGNAVYFLTTHDFRERKAPSGKNKYLVLYITIVGFLPFWFRFW